MIIEEEYVSVANFCSTPELMFQIVYRILCDNRCPVVADAGIHFGETTENDVVMIDALVALRRCGEIKRIAISDFEGHTRGDGFKLRGFEASKNMFLERGLEEETLVRYTLSSKFPPGTDAEALGLVNFAKDHGWTTAYVVVPELHIF